MSDSWYSGKDQVSNPLFPFFSGKDQVSNPLFPFFSGKDQVSNPLFPFFSGKDQVSNPLFPFFSDFTGNVKISICSRVIKPFLNFRHLKQTENHPLRPSQRKSPPSRPKSNLT
ncbi:hypothetical protein CDAR_401161 [Caerostris darwini]|uniref:Uncharacterized protein n=1 Tax=Caerostris darwini TaxID=1538125 RepID=A0AAV4TAE4_9ARAC|nr:hypothetical protein CDAR_401161 [Caerostris darwini]